MSSRARANKMRNASTQLITYLNELRGSGVPNMIYRPNCYVITLRTGQNLYFTDWDLPVTDNNAISYSASSLQISGMKYACKLGTDVDQQQITLSATGAYTLNGVPWLTAIKNGILDGAFLGRYIVFLNGVTLADAAAPIGTLLMFKGRIGQVDQVGRTTAKITVNSDLVLLDMNMPRNLYSPACTHVLFDAGCGLNAADFTFSGAVGAGATDAFIPWEFGSSAYSQGRIVFTSGVNDGITANIKAGSSAGLQLSYPLDEPCATGDTFTASFGCDHTMSTCTAKFNNLVNFRGFPFIPPPTWMLG